MWKILGYATVYDVDVREKIVLANLSTRKKRRDQSTEYSPWKNARFVGEAFKKATGLNLKDKSFINVTNGTVESKYDKESETLSNIVTIYDFEPYKGN